MTTWTTPDEFEARVAHVARALWPTAGIAGAVMVAGRERDGLYVTEECVHVVEATKRRDLQKARDDAGKLVDLRKQLRVQYPDRAIKLWFVTADAPTADQRTECIKKDVIPTSFAEFQSRLIKKGVRFIFPKRSLPQPQTVRRTWVGTKGTEVINRWVRGH